MAIFYKKGQRAQVKIILVNLKLNIELKYILK